MRSNALSGKRWNQFREDLVAWALEQKEIIEEKVYADGYPPFAVPRSDREVFATLAAMRVAGDPAYWDDPEAVATLERLSERYGPPPSAPPGAPFPMAYPPGYPPS
jgi:hypothetical protein